VGEAELFERTLVGSAEFCELRLVVASLSFISLALALSIHNKQHLLQSIAGNGTSSNFTENVFT